MSGPFLTDIDSRAAVKGSRDPLGIPVDLDPLRSPCRRQPHDGEHLAARLHGAPARLLLRRAPRRDGAREAPSSPPFSSGSSSPAMPAGEVNRDWVFRGTERVRKNLNESPRVTLSADRSHQILSDQKIYGPRGLYTGPARTSGLVEGDPTRLTPAAHAFVEAQYLPILAEEGIRDGKAILDLLALASPKLDTKGKGRRGRRTRATSSHPRQGETVLPRPAPVRRPGR